MIRNNDILVVVYTSHDKIYKSNDILVVGYTSHDKK